MLQCQPANHRCTTTAQKVPYIHIFGHWCLVKKVIHGSKPIKTPHHVFVLPIMRFRCNFQPWVLLTYWGFCSKLLGKWTFFEITFITKKCVPALQIANFDNKTACGGAHQRCASPLHNPVAADPPSLSRVRMQHTLSQLTMRPGGAGRLHLELVFFIKTLTQIHWTQFIN